ncbi:5'/3'-nucleotidase SurE [Natranaerobius thermophilus]|uniref:5'-nucleotidase SurE n=1 Tax=Natranaerobius thermophilus (strain ATCC BAA-1301 / DSM 18059 / JW/NM-WN-LF) TaxID=457570 RepID=SURE_NATTJ|nr:5'/3'-nucleotidase SurE [Natranaerobius thermophilus]B2A4J5.1 RecName: Full=5'-nucleotidase SurE; AltName: Full=Nucleoside 5'-monophosphate phosphohydrolase [Natranaerobius thermophilus JW/NM-WN-LF]ACB85172.1 stationary-phase survival protein SurE [Natranaerobius thermophilus JW/NM-WN-LF]
MKVLLTNDDGIYAPGIFAMAKEIASRDEFEAVVVAPDREQSATGHAITVHKPLRVNNVKKLGEKLEIPFYSVNGTPSDCVKLAVESVMDEKPDLVISGINRGANLGTDVLYSGTVSGAMEAAILNIKSIAVSLVDYDYEDYSTAASYTAYIANIIKDNPEEFENGTLLNVNVPAVEANQLKGVKITRQGFRQYENIFEKRFDPRGKAYYWMAGKVIEDTSDIKTDVASVKENYVSVTPIKYDLTDYNLYNSLSNWEFDD